MKHYAKPVLTFVITVVVCYLLFAFILQKTMLDEWHIGIRIVFSVWAVVLGFTFALSTMRDKK
jgi:hypothetical protein